MAEPNGETRYTEVTPSVPPPVNPADYSDVIRASRAGVLASGERISLIGRWVVLLAALILNHFGNRNSAASVLFVDAVLGAWAVVNAAVSLVLLRGYRPGRWFGLATTAIDLTVATSILYVTGGYSAPTDFSLVFYLLIVASGVRFGLPGAAAAAVVVSLLYIVVGGFTGSSLNPPPGFVLGRIFLFVFVALVAGLLVRDLTSRLDLALRTAIERAGQLDETRRREALEKERAQRLEEIDGVRSEFVSMVTHELQTPIASIKTQADTLLHQQHRLDQPTREALIEGIHRSAAALGGLIEDFTTVNRMDTQHYTYQFAPLDLSQFVRDVVESFPIEAQKHPLRLRIEPGLRVRGDRKRLQQVILNLMSNAVKYSPRGGGIAVMAFVDRDGRAKVSVHDEGLGMREEDLPKLFQKFSRLFDKRSISISGTGLGLYITREIVQAHGGEILVESVWGKGSTFSFVLPLAASSEVETARTTTA
jgi:signal transduction histidine kinase